MLYGRPSRTGCVYVYESSVFATRISFATERTAPNSPSLPDVIVHVGIWSHSAMSQYLPIRFHTSAAGLLTMTSSGMETYVGLATTMPLGAAVGAGACARTAAMKHTANDRHVATTANVFLM